MKLIILSPNLHLLFSGEQKKLLEETFEVEYHTTPWRIQDITSLSSSLEKIVALDPDFCDFKVTREDIDHMQNVKAICLQTTWFQYIDIQYLKEKWVPVTNIQGYSTESVAEQAMGIAFSLARKIPLVIRDGFVINFEKYRWIELFGKNAGIIWLGRIGTRIAELTQALGMKTSYWSKNSRNSHFDYRDLDALIETSDFLFCALAKNDETEKIFTDALISKLKNTTIMITIAPIDHSRFIALANEGKIRWYGCDNQIGKVEDFTWNIMPGAELGWCTEESFRRNGEQWIEAIMDAKNGKFTNQVNA